MTDSDFTYLTGATWLVLFVAYAVRIRRRGSFNATRVTSIGGTPIMGENMMQATYWGLEPVTRALVAMRLTANGVTTLALVLGLGAGAAVSVGRFGLACLLSTVSTLCDILDGQVARATNASSARGELYDAVVDRYTEFALIAGFSVYARASWMLVLIALVAMQASFMISYASAKAEALQVSVPRGIMRRHERAAVLTLAAGLTPILEPALASRLGWAERGHVFAIGLALVAALGTFAAIARLSSIAGALVRRPR